MNAIEWKQFNLVLIMSKILYKDIVFYEKLLHTV